MGASSSEAYNRIVNRTQSSKRVVLAVVVAIVMVASAFVIAAGTHAVSDVGVQLQGWTLKPPANMGWTNGDIKGFCEGDVVPINLEIQPNGHDLVDITVGLEWGLGTETTTELRGFDHAVLYTWTGDPSAPFNNPVDSAKPFVAGDGATITLQENLGLMYDLAPQWRIWDVWHLTIELDDVDETWVRVGGLLYITTYEQRGAAYFPGSSLHVRLVAVNDQTSAEDLAINVEEILTPPNIVLEKFCNPATAVVGQTMTFTIAWENIGMANATELELWDIIPVDEVGDPILEYVSGSGMLWNSTDPTEVPVPDPVEAYVEDPMLAWVWDTDWIAEGTGAGALNPVIVYYLQFQVTVVGWKFGEQENVVKLWYSDDHNCDPTFEIARCSFTILYPDITIEKWELDELTCAAGWYLMYYDECGEPVYSQGDTVYYVIRVTNPSPDTMMDYFVVDPVLGGETNIMSGTLAPGDYDQMTFPYTVTGTEFEPAETNYMFRNIATVVAWDGGLIGGKLTKSSYWDIDIVHPDVTITKTADCSVAAIGEEVQYTIVVENTGDIALDTFAVWDYMLDPLNPIYLANIMGGVDDPDDLAPGEILVLDSSVNMKLGHVVEPDDVDQDGFITNTASVTAYDEQGHYLYREDTVRILLVSPYITITKTAVDEDGDEITEIGLTGTVRYEITVENTGDVGLWWFYWDSMADINWDPVPNDGPIWTNVGDYYIDGCWAVEFGEYCGHVPVAMAPQDGVVAMSLNDTFVGDDFSYEVDIYPYDSYWRAGVLLRYDEATGDGYLAHIFEGGVVLYKISGNLLYTLGTYSTAVSSGAWHTLKVVIETPGPDSFFDVYLDGSKVIDATDSDPLAAGKIGLAVWDEGVNPVHVHFDDVVVESLGGTVLLEEHFASLMPETPAVLPDLPFADGVPFFVECPYYHGKLWSGYLEAEYSDTKYYVYEVQDDDPDPLIDCAVAIGWWTEDGTDDPESEIVHPESFVWDCDEASVRIRGWIFGYVYHDHNLDDTQMGVGDSALGGWTVHLYDSTGTNELESFSTQGTGYYVFDMRAPGDYMIKVDMFSTAWFSTNPKDLSDPEGLWESASVLAGFGTRQDFGAAEYAYIEGFKWNDWDLDGEQDYPDGMLEPYLDGWLIICEGWEYDDDMTGPPTVHLEAVTGADGIPGHYKFTVKPGTYDISEVVPADDPLTPFVDESAWYQTFPGGSGVHEDFDIIEGATSPSKDFGNVPLTTIWGHKFYDKILLDGVMDEDDIALNGWTITLTGVDPQGAPVVIAPTVTGMRAVDVVFAIDLSGSMGDSMAAIEAAISSVMGDLVAAGVDARFGVMTFVDYPGYYSSTQAGSVPLTYAETYGVGSDYAYQLDQPLTSDTSAVEAVVGSLPIYSGYDWPQDYSRVIYESYSDPEIAWRYCTERVLMVFGDAWAHDTDFDINNDGVKDNSGGDPGRDEVMGTSDDLDFQTVVAGAAAHGVRIMGVFCGYSSPYQWQYMADQTGGANVKLADVDDATAAILDLLGGFFSFQGVKPGTYTLGEIEPVGQEDYWFMTTRKEALVIEIVRPTIPGEKIRVDIGNMRYGLVWGYKFVDEYGGTPEEPTYPNGLFDVGESGYPGWPIHWKLVGGIEPVASPIETMDDDDMTGDVDETGKYGLMLLPGDYEIWEDVLFGWEATTPWGVWITIPAHPWGPPVIKRVDFGNTVPLSDPMVPFVLEAGWNMWSAPITVSGLTAAGLLEAIGPAGLLVTALDETKAEYYSYLSGWSSEYDFQIVPGDGYYVYVMERVSFILVGDLIGPSVVALSAGWNLIGYSSLTAVKASELLGMVTGCTALLVTGLDAAEARYYSYLSGWSSDYDFTVSPGKAFFIWVDGPGTLVYG